MSKPERERSSGWNRARYRDDGAPEKVVLTPQWLVERIRNDVFGGTIDLDPATTPVNPCGAVKFASAPFEDGLAIEWAGRVFVNPPWGDRALSIWVAKAIKAASAGCEVVFLAPTRTDTRWFHAALEGADALLLFSKRLDFADGMRTRARGAFGALFASGLFAFNADIQPLADLGYIVKATLLKKALVDAEDVRR